MIFTIATQELFKTLQIVNGAVGTNSTLPILESFLFDILDNELTITATDLETTMTTSLEVDADANGQVAIPAKLLMDVLKSLPDQPLTFKINEETQAISIVSQNGKYTLAGEPGEDFPVVSQTEEDTETVQLKAGILQQAISQSLFAVSTDELRPAMTGVLCSLQNEGVTFVATDAHRLVKFDYWATEEEGWHQAEPYNLILPRKALNLLKNALPTDDTDINIAYNDTNAFFSFGNTNLSCRLIDARYPNYQAVIPVDNPNKLTLSRSDLQNALRRISLFANKTTYQVSLDIKATQVKLMAQDIDFSHEAVEYISCQYEGEEIAIAFNGKFLREILGILKDDEIVFELANPRKAGILVPAQQAEQTNLLILLMPLMQNY